MQQMTAFQWNNVFVMNVQQKSLQLRIIFQLLKFKLANAAFVLSYVLTWKKKLKDWKEWVPCLHKNVLGLFLFLLNEKFEECFDFFV